MLTQLIFITLLTLAHLSFNGCLILIHNHTSRFNSETKYNNRFTRVKYFHLNSKWYKPYREIPKEFNPKIVKGMMTVTAKNRLEYFWLIILMKFNSLCEYFGIHN